MTAWLLSLLGPDSILWGLGLAAIGALVMWARSGGKASERAKQAKDKLAAAQDRFEMNREATAAEREAQAMTDESALKEALKWRKR